METYACSVPFDEGPSEELPMGLASRDAGADPAEAVALIAAARRARLMGIHRRRLRWEDLEDCYSQATLEILTRSRRSPFASPEHVLNALEQKFLSRIEDRRRAIGGRSAIETAMARAVPVDSAEHGVVELEDRRVGVERQVMARTELSRLRELIGDLSRDQQLLLASEVLVDMGPGEFCARYGWSLEKYRKVAQRARGKLRVLLEEYEVGDRCRRLEPDLLAMSAGVASDVTLTRARAHVANCPSCARMVGDLDRAAHSVAVLLPIPGAVAAGGLAARFGGVFAALRRALFVMRHPLAETGGSGAGVAGSSIAGVGALKVGIAAICVAGAAGSLAVCARLGVIVPIAPGQRPHHAIVVRPSHKGVRRTVAAEPSQTLSPARTAVFEVPARLAHTVSHPRISALAQTRREFGTPPARTASAGIADGGSSLTGTAGASGGPERAAAASAEPAATSAQTNQTRAEFGFEK